MWLKFVVCGVRADTKGKTAHIFLKHNVNECPFTINEQSLAAFCLPLGPETQTPKERMSHEEYTFTLTQGDGTRVQGFCRRFLPPAPRVGSKLRFPQVLCLVCEAAWPTLFFKVLEVAEQLLRQTDLLLDFEHLELPASSYAGIFLGNLGRALEQQPALGTVFRVALPSLPAPLCISPPKRCCSGDDSQPLAITDEFLELQVPADCGNGLSNAGVSLARLLWHVPVPAMLTLIASLLLERRVLVVGQSRDMVSAAVCAAAALIYPFKWHHILLPLLPRSLKDYLTAPMPFLIGMPAQLLPALKGIPMDEVTLIDLDLGRCEPSPGSAHDDALMLPWREQLEQALHAAFGLLRSPTEHESNPLITNIMQGYFLKLLGTYRSHIYKDGSGPCCPQSPRTAANGGSHSCSPSPAPGMHGSSSSSSLTGLSESLAAAGIGGGGRPHTGGGGVVGMSGRHTPSSSLASVRDDSLKGHGHWFDHAGLVASHRHNAHARAFLQLLRQSQLYEVFVRERLEMAEKIPGGPECSDDPFEQLVNSYLENRRNRISARLGAGVRSGISRFTAFVKKHRRTESSQNTLAGGVQGSSGSSFSLAAFNESPEAARLKVLASTFAAAAVGAGKMRRNLTEGTNLAFLQASAAAGAGPSAGTGATTAASDRSPSPPTPGHSHRHTISSVEGLADRIHSSLDPSAFFGDEDDDLDAEAEAAAEAEQRLGGNRFSRNSSSNSLKELAVGSSGPSWSAAAGSSGGSFSTAAIGNPVYAGSNSNPHSSSSSFSFNRGTVASQQQQQQQQQHSPPLQRRSVPLFGSGGVERVPSPPPMIDFRAGNGSSSSSNVAVAAAMSGRSGTAHHHQQQQSQSRSNSSYLQHQEQLLQQPQPQQHRSSLSPAAALAATAGPGSAAAAAAAVASHRSSQHQHLKAALASISAGPLPQPPVPRGRSVSQSTSLRPPQMPAVTAPQQQHQQGQQQLSFSVVSAAAVAAGGSSGGGSVAALATSAPPAVWDPFLELLNERTTGAAGGAGADAHVATAATAAAAAATVAAAPVHSNSGSGVMALSGCEGPLTVTSSSRGASSSSGGGGMEHFLSAQGGSSSRGSTGSGGGATNSSSGGFGVSALDHQQQPTRCADVTDLLSLTGSFPVTAGAAAGAPGSGRDGNKVGSSCIDTAGLGLGSSSSLIELVADCSNTGSGSCSSSNYSRAAAGAVTAAAKGPSDPGMDALEMLMMPASGVARSDSLLDM